MQVFLDSKILPIFTLTDLSEEKSGTTIHDLDYDWSLNGK